MLGNFSYKNATKLYFGDANSIFPEKMTIRATISQKLL